MAAIIYNRYYKSSFITFNNNLILWAQMSPDHFWPAVLFHSLNSYALFRDVLQKTQEFIRTHEHDHPVQLPPIPPQRVKLFNPLQ